MKRNPAFNYKLRQVINITLFWLVVNLVVELCFAVNYDPVTKKHFLYFIFGHSALEHFLITSIGPVFGGLTGGAFIVFYQREKLKGKTYGRKLLIHSLLFIAFVTISVLVVGIIGAATNKAGVSYWQNFYNDVFSYRVLRLLIAWYFVVIITMFILDVSEKYGPGTLRRILLGKYHSHGREERIFMFLDLRASTTIAETIGDETYFRMLHFFYEVANDAVLNSYGEVYQYVGDEIVVSWKKETGLRNANCLRCFKAIGEAVQEKAPHFQSAFGVVPSFKAGIHAGWVVTGLIGSVKKEIVYSGDVLNTTARMMALCKEYNQELIVSDKIAEPLKNNPGFTFTYLGSPVLRGKAKQTALYGTKMVSSDS